MACEEFCNDYLVLKPEEGGIYDLFHLLFSSNVEENRLTECPIGTRINEFKHRKLIFVSMLAQKILLSIRKPMACFGALLEMMLNLLTNLFKGKLIMPDPKSETFASTVGFMDYRVELDQKIEHDDSRYNGALAMMASKLAYENEAFIQNIVTNHWKMDFLGFYNFWNDYQQELSTQAFMFRVKRGDSDLIMVAFRGTPPFNAVAWSTDVDLSWYELPNVGRVHGGFMKALGLQKVQGWPQVIQQGDNSHPAAYYTTKDKLKNMLQQNENAKFIVTGHSLGGAIAVLFPLVLAYHEESWMLKKMEGVYTYGQPRVGDEKFGDFMDKQLSEHGVQYVRYVYCNDMVPRLPYDDSVTLFKHFGTCFYFNSHYVGKIVEDEPNKNYFSVMTVIPMMLNAVWELISSFLIPYVKGPDYREGWFMTIFRVIGLIIPGVSAHLPPNYVNCTRLRSSILPQQHQNPTLVRKLD